MTLILNGNDFKYELEAVAKLFFPAQLFDFVYNDEDAKNNLDDYCEVAIKEDGETMVLTCKASCDGKNEALTSEISASFSDEAAKQHECELELARLMLKVLSKLTDKPAKWGILTGVRPVKRINEMLNKGYDYKMISKVLKEQFLVDDRKIQIAYETAKSQQNILKDMSNDSYSLYISIPFCPSRCAYCSFISQEADKNLNLIPEYVQKLCKEIRYTGKAMRGLPMRLDTIYIGGGTPTSLEVPYLEAVMKSISESFDLSALREYTVEAGRPDTITKEKLEVIKSNGAQRVSINPQTLNDDVLNAIGRKHTVKQFFDAHKLVKGFGFTSINTDIIAGLTDDTIESFMTTVDGVISLAPENITVHTLSIKRAARLNSESKSVLSNPAEEMVEYATKRLLESGYKPYYLYRQKNMLENLENIGWTKNGHESLYNIYIMEEIQSIIALGSGASSKIIQENDIKRVFNYKLPLEYINNFDLMLNKKDEIIDMLRFGECNV